MSGTKLDVTLVCGARPELLLPTLQSFQKRVFKHFDLGTCYANIDLFGGNEDDRKACREIIQQHFKSVKITEPATPSFGMAVKTIWSQVQSPFVLHMEDDWEVLEDITPARVLPLFVGPTRAVKLVCKELMWNGNDQYYERTRKYRMFGLIVWKSLRKRSIFGTSPAFFSADFVRSAAMMMDPSLDPEKQMRPKNNPQLAAYVEQFRCKLLPGLAQQNIIRDTGRDWRSERGIEKVIVAGRSVWKQAEPG
jgi:hypothetical protein